MADQPITGLPTKTASGVASTDKMLGIDSAEGYQILVRDVAKYIIENCNVSTLAGAVQTPKAAIDGLNSNKASLSRSALSTPNLLDDTISAGYYYVTNSTNFPTGVSSNGYFDVSYRTSFSDTIRIIHYQPHDSTDQYENLRKGTSSWSGWVKLPTRNEIDLLNSKTAHTNWGTTLSVTSTGTIHGILLIANYFYVQVWMPATSDINIFVMSPSSVYAKAGTDSLSFGATSSATTYTLERTGNKSFTFTSSETSTLTWISY